MNEGIHLDLDTWIVPGQIRKDYYYYSLLRACLMGGGE